MYEDIIDKEVLKKMKKYERKFHDIFPLMLFGGDREELLEELDTCIKTKKKYDASFYDNEDVLS